MENEHLILCVSLERKKNSFPLNLMVKLVYLRVFSKMKWVAGGVLYFQDYHPLYIKPDIPSPTN